VYRPVLPCTSSSSRCGRRPEWATARVFRHGRECTSQLVEILANARGQQIPIILAPTYRKPKL
jgi:hypothetical protein